MKWDGYPNDWDAVVRTWKEAARQIGLHFGLNVEVIHSDNEIVFLYLDQKFHSLRDLKKALRMKAFL